MTKDRTTIATSAERYELVPLETELRFRTRHVLGLAAVSGSIQVRSGGATLDSTDRSLLAVEAVLDMRTFDSASHARDRIVASPRFLDSARHREATYHSSSVERRDGGWLVHGALTVKGRTAAVDLHVDDFGSTVTVGARVTASAVIDRTEFGISVPSFLAAKKLFVSIEARALPSTDA